MTTTNSKNINSTTGGVNIGHNADISGSFNSQNAAVTINPLSQHILQPQQQPIVPHPFPQQLAFQFGALPPPHLLIPQQHIAPQLNPVLPPILPGGPQLGPIQAQAPNGAVAPPQLILRGSGVVGGSIYRQFIPNAPTSPFSPNTSHLSSPGVARLTGYSSAHTSNQAYGGTRGGVEFPVSRVRYNPTASVRYNPHNLFHSGAVHLGGVQTNKIKDVASKDKSSL